MSGCLPATGYLCRVLIVSGALSGQRVIAANPQNPVLTPLPARGNPCQVLPGDFTLSYESMSYMYRLDGCGPARIRLNLG